MPRPLLVTIPDVDDVVGNENAVAVDVGLPSLVVRLLLDEEKANDAGDVVVVNDVVVVVAVEAAPTWHSVAVEADLRAFHSTVENGV